MVKKKDFKSIIPVIIILVTFAIIMFLSSGKSIVEIERVTGTESIKSFQGIELSQAVFGVETFDLEGSLQSAIPATESDNLAVIRVEILNPTQENLKITRVIVSENDKQTQTQDIHKSLQPSETFIFKTDEIRLEGELTVLQTIKVQAFLENAAGDQFHQTYSYGYFPLSECVSDAECDVPYSTCDIDNIAGYSDGRQTFCVRPCSTSTDCTTGQLCFQGRCGYAN